MQLPSSGMGRKKSSELGAGEEVEPQEESGSEFVVDDEEEKDSGQASDSEDEDSDDPDFGLTRKRKGGGGGGGGRGGSGGKRAAHGNRKTATVAPGAAAPPPTYKYRGVSWVPGFRRWDARFKHNGQQMKLGNFVTEEGAARAHDRISAGAEAGAEVTARRLFFGVGLVYFFFYSLLV